MSIERASSVHAGGARASSGNHWRADGAEVATSPRAVGPRSLSERVSASGVDGHSSPLSFGEQIANQLDRFENGWTEIDRKSALIIKRAPKRLQDLIELQLSAQRITCSSQLLSSCGEAATGTVKRLQQMGGG